MEAAAKLPDAWAPTVHDVPRCRCFGARIDVVGLLHGDPCVVEIKSGSVQRTHWLQLKAQWELYEPASYGLLVQLAADGSYAAPDWPDHPYLSTVLAAAEVAQWRLRNDPKAKLSDDGPHALRRSDGIRVPGIGTVLRLAGLVDLRDIPSHILEKASARGTYVHSMIELDVQHDLDEASIDPSMRGYLDAWRSFCAREKFAPERAEVPVVYHCEQA